MKHDKSSEEQTNMSSNSKNKNIANLQISDDMISTRPFHGLGDHA